MARKDDDIDLIKTNIGQAKLETLAENSFAFEDKKGVYPSREYLNVASTNLAARGLKRNELYLGGGDHNLSLDLYKQLNSTYPLNQVRETVSGHVTEIDDTPGNERMLFKHKTGSGIELRADGTVIISATNNTIRITGGDEKVIIEGDGHISYNGNLTLDVTGDFDLKVGGDMNVRVAGDKTEEVVGSVKQRIYRDHETNVHQNRSEYVLGVTTETRLGDHNTITKGNVRNYTEGNVQFLSGGDMKLSAENQITITSDYISQSAKEKLFITGSSGTIGSTEIVYYGKGGTFEEGVTAPTFTGDLEGKADYAADADHATGADKAAAPGNETPSFITPVATPTTVKPTPSMVADMASNSSKGINKIKIDTGDVLKNQLNKDADYGGVSDRRLTTAEIRSKMRDPNTSANTSFVGSQIAEGKLSATYINQIPPAIGRTANKDPKPKRGADRIGQSDGQRARFEI